MDLKTFITRPILSSTISVLIVLVGVISLLTLPVERYPSIAPPRVEVSTFFTGANSETVLKSVITPLEQEINGVEHMIYINSSAANTGEVIVDVYFAQGTDPDMATVNVQNRVQKALARLPQEVKDFGVTTEKVENSMLQIFSVYSPDDTYDYNFLSNYASINIKTRLLQIDGVGKFQMLGSDYSMRVWLDPDKMAQHKLVPADVIGVLSQQNIEAATGTIGENSSETYQYSLRYTGRLKTPEEFENIVIRSEQDGSILRLGDLGSCELGMEMYNMTGETNGHPGVMCIAYQISGSNATKVNEEISKALEEIQASAPSGVKICLLMSTNEFLYAAIDQVIETLRDAILLVILIVLIFLKDFKSTLIPFISIMVSLIGTFAFMTIAGFSINLLTLFALVLVIGTVVDDSIVVVEAVHAKFESGVTDPTKATIQAIKEVTSPVITSSLVFMAVFIPVSFMGGTSGVFYQQFGLSMAVAVGISALNALTLVPALCAIMLKPIKKIEKGEKGTLKQRYARWFDNLFDRFSMSYQNVLRKVMKVKPLMWIVCGGALAALVILMSVMAPGLVPMEDQGILFVEISALPGSSIHTTNKIAKEFTDKIMEVDGVSDVSTSVGFGFIAGSNASAAIMIVRLDPWDERGGETSFLSLFKKMNEIGKEFPEVNTTVFTTPMIPGYGSNSGIDFYVQDRRGGTIAELFNAAKDFCDVLQKNGIKAYMAFSMDYPQWEVSVDVAKCMRAGLSPKDVLNTLGCYYGGAYSTDINLYSKVYKVMIMGTPDSRRDDFSLNRTYVRTASGEMSPITNFIKIKKVFGPDAIKTFNLYTSINISAASDMGAGNAITLINKLAKETLPEGYTVDYSGMSREQNNQGGLGMILILCSFIIYLLLAALYESLVIPFAVLLAVPLGLAGSYTASYLVGLDNNIYLQTGVIMLIGLLSKTAILITEFAVERHRKGMPIEEAAIAAAGARLRPIIMTAGTMVIGLFPLIMAVGGVGGMGNFSLGIGTIVGMLLGTVGLLFITPTLYVTFQKIQDKIKPMTEEEEDKEDE